MLLFLACVPHDPPMRSMLDVPRAPSRGLPFETESEAGDLVASTLTGAGFPDVGAVRLELDEQTLLPQRSGDQLRVRPFVTTPAEARAHVAEIGVALWGAPLLLPEWSDEALFSGYLAFHVAAIGHEMSHGVAAAVHSRDNDDLYVEELRARDVEWPLLDRLAQQQRIPASWLPLYGKFLRAIADAAPPTARPPTDAAARNDAFVRGFETGGRPDEDARAAMWMALTYSADRAEKPAMAFSDLLAEFEPWPDPARRTVERALTDAGWTASDDGSWQGTAFGLPHPARLHIDADALVVGEVRLVIPRVAPAERARILELLNLANGFDVVTLMLRDDEILARSAAIPARDPERIRGAVRGPAARLEQIAAVLPDVRTGKISPAAAWAKLSASLGGG